ncbi:RAD55 family ATPase [Haloplanus halophilus]|uniref:RAD55 family ATPase n=1 Tax=Haloplanus halophilus TaxID=2949993 RepID=UPI00204164B1|nr:recombinase RecA [Haloplanus sp. GDY1]
MAYSTPEVLPVDEFAPGTSLLISGPPLTRKRELMIRLLGGDPDEETIMVTTKLGAGKLLERFREWNGDRQPGLLHVVDCVTKTRGLGTVRETETTSYLSSPHDMTGLSIELSGQFRRAHASDRPIRFGVHSLSTFLMYHDLQRVYRMLHVLTGQIESVGGLGVFVVDSPTDREQSILTQLIDGVVETRETDEDCELRLRGLGGRAAGWRSY